MNDFLSSFEDSFGQLDIVERQLQVPCSAVSPVPMRALIYPPQLLLFVENHLQVCHHVSRQSSGQLKPLLPAFGDASASVLCQAGILDVTLQ